MKALALLLLASPLLAPSPLRAQTIELRGGDSTLFQAAGGSAVLYMPNATYQAGLGVVNGRLVAGADARFKWGSWDAVLGDEQLFLTTGQAGIAESLRGLSLSKHDKTQSLTLFAGLTGSAYSAPYFSGTTAKTPSAGFQFTRVLSRGFAFSTVQSIAGSKRTALQEVDWLHRALRVTATGGVLENQKFFSGLATGQWKHFGASLGHSDYFYKAQRSTVNSAGVALAAGPFSANASAFQSQQARGQAVSAGLRLGSVQVQGQELFSKYGRTTMASIVEQVSRHFRLAQYATFSGGKTSFNAGGGWTSNRASVDVSYQAEYNPFGPRAFSKALVVQFSLHLHGINVNAGTLTGPDGKTKFTAYGNSFIETGIQVQGAAQGRKVGGVRYAGRVLDALGSPVAGAAVQVGTQTAWTDETGAFQVTTKRAETLPVQLMLEDFTAPGEWACVSCPPSATPNDFVQIVVRRK
jgi:hypothetical protein